MLVALLSVRMADESAGFLIPGSFESFRTELDLSYARGFDEVCTTSYSDTTPPSARQALDSSDGCFSSDDPDRATRDIELDNYQGAWTQSFTPVLTAQFIFTGQLQNGFLENPYRSVVIAPSGDRLSIRPIVNVEGVVQ